MTTPTKRSVGRPRKKQENPDCEVATRGFVKCLMRKYHEQQTVKNMEHRRGSEGILGMVAWGAIAILCVVLWCISGDDLAKFAAIGSGLLFINALFTSGGWEDTMRESAKHTDFMQKHEEPPCEPKRGCEE